MLRKSQVRTVFSLSLFFLSVSINWSQSTNDPTTFFVPIVLAEGGAGGSNYSSELTLANRSDREVAAEFTYTAAFGEGSGTAIDSLQAGQQRIVPDAIAYLRQLGLAIPESGSQGGTLRIRFFGVTSLNEACVLVRTTTLVPEGRAGVSYSGVPLGSLLEGPAYLCGLRQNTADRSNVALQNAGDPGSGDITLRVRVLSGNPDLPVATDLPDIVLPPGGFHQINEVLISNGLSLTSGYVRVERISGLAPYYAYAVVNSQLSSRPEYMPQVAWDALDGSFIAPAPEGAWAGSYRLTLPIDSGSQPSSISEWVLTNPSSSDTEVRISSLRWFYGEPESWTDFNLRSGEQKILRSNRGAAISGVSPMVVDLPMSDLHVGVRVVGLERDLRYGFFYAGIPSERESQTDVWLFGLQQDSETRTSLILVNLVDQNAAFDIELFDGETGLKARTVGNISAAARNSLQIDSVLAYAPGVTQGYARVVASRSGLFVAHALIVDRSGDGSVIYSLP